MVRMKLDKKDFNPRELDVPYEGPQFERYTGDIPRSGTVLIARVTKAWWTESKDGDSQMALLVVAEQNNGEKKQYNGLPIWEYITFVKTGSRRYQAFLYNFDLTVDDVFAKMDVQVNDDRIGTPINSIAGWVVGSDEAIAQVVTKRDTRDPDNLRAQIDWDGWIPFDMLTTDDDDDEEDEEEEDTRPPARAKAPSRTTRGQARGAKAAGARGRSRDVPDDDDEDEDDDADYDVDDDDEDEDDEEDVRPPARSASSRRATSGRGAASTRSSTRPERNARAARKSAGAARSSTAASNRRANAAAARDRDEGGSDDEPPF